MNKIRNLEQPLGFLVGVIFLLLFVMLPSSSAAVTVSVDSADWPMWPEPAKQINELPVMEPATFLSIGREVVPWPFFGVTEDSDSDGFLNLVGANLYFTIETFDGTYDDSGNLISKTVTGYVTSKPTINNSDTLFYVLPKKGLSSPFLSSVKSANLTEENLVNGDSSFEGLHDLSVIPEYNGAWIVSGDEFSVANESLCADTSANQYVYLKGWKSFLVEDLEIPDPITSSNFTFADSGHAPPHMVWPFDPWLYSYRQKTGYDATVLNDSLGAWKDRYVCLWPTNQGAMQSFEVKQVDVENAENPHAERSWLAVPAPAIRQSIYHVMRKAYESENEYERFTVLDGPVTVRDVEFGEGNWKRIAVGTTGVGTKQLLKPTDAWDRLEQIESGYAPDSADISGDFDNAGNGRVFGVYAFNFTDLEETATSDTLVPQWSVSNVFYETSAQPDFHEYYVNTYSGEPADSDYSPYADMKFSVSKPLIGYTLDGSGNREWHIIILGVEKETNKYIWLDINPESGSVKDSGYFYNSDTKANEVLPVILEKKNGPILFEQEEAEVLHPSRILAAFPPSDSNYREPLLSDVYVYLSNGSIYRWDLNESHSNSNPEHVVTLTNNDDQPASPLTDFDITYIDGDTYLAANVVLTYQGGADHDTEGLIIVNLSKIGSGVGFTPPGQAGDRLEITDDEGEFLLGIVQLQGLRGGDDPERKTVLASPVFVGGKVYLSFYELNYKGQGFNASRLYVIDFLDPDRSNAGWLTKAEELEDLEGDGEYYDFDKKEAIMMFIDSQGNLVVVFEDDSGNITTETISTGLELFVDYPDSGTDPFESTGVHTVYWRTK